MKPLSIIPHGECTGCETCLAACVAKCITMQQDEHGFYYPYVNTESCVNCGACQRVCPVIDANQECIVSEIYACRAASRQVLESSSSGGLFTIISQAILSKGGIVCGAAFNSDLMLNHELTDDDHLWKLRGSKYVQSRAGDAMSKIREFLSKGRSVLFSGTPCQVAGIRKLLRNYPPGLLLCVELVCHGVPSPGVFAKYINDIENKNQSKITLVNFRDKTMGWSNYCFTVNFENGKKWSVEGCKNKYILGFINNLFIRESCTICKFKGFRSGADITIGDFWGIDTLNIKEFSDDRGVSLVCVNTQRGKDIFDAIRPLLSNVISTDIITASKMNQCLITPTKYNPRTRRFYRYIKRMSVENAVDMASHITFLDRVLASIKYRLGRLIN